VRLLVLCAQQRTGEDGQRQCGKLNFAPANESREANAMSGTMRQLVNNMSNT
jgi:ribosomal protein L6P/L9E